VSQQPPQHETSSLAESVGTGTDGLAQLQALIASKQKPGMLHSLEFDFIEVARGFAVFAGTPGEGAASASQDLRLDLREAPIHRQFGARDVTAVVAGEKHHGFRDVIGRA
jgi:hypothetical protein